MNERQCWERERESSSSGAKSGNRLRVWNGVSLLGGAWWCRSVGRSAANQKTRRPYPPPPPPRTHTRARLAMQRSSSDARALAKEKQRASSSPRPLSPRTRKHFRSSSVKMVSRQPCSTLERLPREQPQWRSEPLLSSRPCGQATPQASLMVMDHHGRADEAGGCGVAWGPCEAGRPPPASAQANTAPSPPSLLTLPPPFSTTTTTTNSRSRSRRSRSSSSPRAARTRGR